MTELFSNIEGQRSQFIIGPLSYTYPVQRITVQEQRAVESIEPTRSTKGLVVDSGDTTQMAEVRLLFTGLEEINDGLRPLVALFRCSPITSIKNEFLSNLWARNTILEDEKKKRNLYVPVAFQQLTLETVPDIPYAIQATIILTRLDVTSATGSDLLYQGGSKSEWSVDPRNGVWLKKWINKVLETNQILQIGESDFSNVSFSWYAKDAIGRSIDSNPITKTAIDKKRITFNAEKDSKIAAESCTLTHRFGFNKLKTGYAPFPQHMGVSARAYSIDIVFDTLEAPEEFKEFVHFKETSDSIIRSTNRYDRVNGWQVSSPIIKLLGISKSQDNTLYEKPGNGVFVNINSSITTTDIPGIKNCRLDLIENNPDFFEETELLIESGGQDYDLLKEYFLRELKNKEAFFRSKLFDADVDKRALLTSSDATLIDSFEAYRIFWPVKDSVTAIDKDSTFGLLNIDTIRATLLSPRFDTDRKLRNALTNTKLATGKVVLTASDITFLQRLSLGLDNVVRGISGPSTDDSELSESYRIIRAMVDRMLINNSLTPNPEEDEEFFNEIAVLLFQGFLGDRNTAFSFEGSTGQAIQKLATSRYRFRQDFAEALFDVIVERKSTPINLPYVFNPDGISGAYFKLITNYIKYTDSRLFVQSRNEELRAENTQGFRRSVFADLLLPTYKDLFEDRWIEFAPTYDDLGLVNWYSVKTSEDSRPIQSAPAVTEEDVVDPSVWFFHRRKKVGLANLRDSIDDNTSLAMSVQHDLSLSIPFNTQQIDRLEELLQKKAEEGPDFDSRPLTTLISNALDRYRTSSPEEYRQDIAKLRLLSSEKYYERYLGPKADKLKIYIHNNGNYSTPRQFTVPGLASEIYRVADNEKLLSTNSALPNIDADEALRTPIDTQTEFIRHLDSNTLETVRSNIDQIPDDYFNPNKFFPALKVYLIEQRGNDIFADDSFFALNPVISVDITQDKDDASLAVIRVADPLYTLQGSNFPSSNVLYNKKDKDSKTSYNSNDYDSQEEKREDKTVLGGIRNEFTSGYLKRKKVIQGRPVQIRMGYTSMPKNMEVVFTGRITEIEPGDVLTIVAQGWKAELINRQVSFYNDNPKNWGARDLAIQAITLADPQGFGEFFPERDAQYLLRNINNFNGGDVVDNVLRNQRGVDIATAGDRSILGSALNSIVTTLGLQSLDKRNQGLDTRLKNLWQPDLGNYNNTFGLRSFFGTLPAFTLDSWVVPIQPAWEVLKESTRHAWNCITQVVPYDSQATIFMGHPDQPYFFTRGDSGTRAAWRKYISEVNRRVYAGVEKVLDGFYESNYYSHEENVKGNIYEKWKDRVISSFFKTVGGSRIAVSQSTLLDSTKRFYTGIDLLNGEEKLTGILGEAVKPDFKFVVENLRFEESENEILASPVPYSAYKQLKDILKDNTGPTLVSVFFQLPREEVLRSWRTVNSDIDNLMQPSALVNLEEIKRSVGRGTELITSRTYEQELAEIESIADSITGRSPKISDINRLKRIKSKLQGVGVVGYTRVAEVIRRCTEWVDQTLRITNELDTSITGSSDDYRTNQKYMLEAKSAIKQYIELARSELQKISSVGKVKGFGQDLTDASIKEVIVDKLALFKAFIYFFSKYATSDAEAQPAIQSIAKASTISLPPNMRVFRVHHYIDSDADIINNAIVASTKEMWNSVVIEHPAVGESETIVNGNDQVFGAGNFQSSVSWNYFPSQDITGVIGLQFHPGLSLANKKLKVFTELNCQGGETAARLACTHLAEGIRRMYRGTLMVRGRIIKPHDRIILNDKYNQMTGPLEVESVIHHWNTQQGWVTNIVPQAICDANPGAAIIQTAILDATYQSVFSTIDFVSDAVMIATIVATLGAGTPVGAGLGFGVRKGLKNLFLDYAKNGAKKGTINVGKRVGVGALKLKDTIVAGGLNPLATLREAYRNFGGVANSLAKNYLLLGAADRATYLAYRMNVVSAFVEASENVEQLPVIFSPLIYNATPFVAGLETDDAIHSIFTNDFYYSLRDIQAGAEQVLGALLDDDSVFN